MNEPSPSNPAGATPWPNFLVIGAYKSATSSLHYYLQQHPQVFVPKRKEPNYFAFAEDPDRTHVAYRKSVIDAAEYHALFADVGGETAIGEVSPEYMTHPGACAAIAAAVPGVRLIAVLRNPIERAYSDYAMYRASGQERMRFRQALEQQDARAAAAAADATGFYISTGMYGAQLEPYFRTFARAQIKLVRFEALSAHPRDSMRGIFAFLGVDATLDITDLAHQNVSYAPRYGFTRRPLQLLRHVSTVAERVLPVAIVEPLRRGIKRCFYNPSLASDDRRRLGEIYRRDLALLGELSGEDFSD